MNRNYETLSLETHLFFGRIMKEHALFLMAGFPAKNADYIEKADWYRVQFEELLRETVELSKTGIGAEVLESGEIVTEYTLGAEKKTRCLTGIDIDSRITEAEKELRASGSRNCCKRRAQMVRNLNRKALRLTDGLINFKEKI